MPSTPRSAIVRAVGVGVAIQLLFAFFFVVPGHDPEPNGLPIGVVAPADVAQRLAAELERRADGLDVKTYADAAAARAAIGDREVYGAIVAPGGRPEQVLVSSAQSVPVASVISGLADGAPVEDVSPLPEGDPRGVTLNLLVLPAIITSILGGLLGMQFAPRLKTAQRVPLVLLVGVLSGLGTIALVHLLDALPGSYLAEVGVMAFGVFAIALCAVGIIRLIGPPGIFVAFVVFLMLGNPASGLASAPELLPTPWAEVGPLLPPGALGSALRGTAHFDGAGIIGPLLVLAAWTVIGIALNVIADRRPAPAPAS